MKRPDPFDLMLWLASTLGAIALTGIAVIAAVALCT